MAALCPEQQRLLTEETHTWRAYRVMEASSPNSPDLKELATKAGAASHQLRLHVDTCPLGTSFQVQGRKMLRLIKTDLAPTWKPHFCN
jgi:hypothetical protein